MGLEPTSNREAITIVLAGKEPQTTEQITAGCQKLGRNVDQGVIESLLLNLARQSYVAKGRGGAWVWIAAVAKPPVKPPVVAPSESVNGSPDSTEDPKRTANGMLAELPKPIPATSLGGKHFVRPAILTPDQLVTVAVAITDTDIAETLASPLGQPEKKFQQSVLETLGKRMETRDWLWSIKAIPNQVGLFRLTCRGKDPSRCQNRAERGAPHDKPKAESAKPDHEPISVVMDELAKPADSFGDGTAALVERLEAQRKRLTEQLAQNAKNLDAARLTLTLIRGMKDGKKG